MLPELVLPANDYEFLERLWQEWSPGHTPDAASMAQLKQTLAAPGALEPGTPA